MRERWDVIAGVLEDEQEKEKEENGNEGGEKVEKQRATNFHPAPQNATQSNCCVGLGFPSIANTKHATPYLVSAPARGEVETKGRATGNR